VAWTSSYYQINLVGLQGKLDSVIGLELFYCNRLGLDAHHCTLSLYKERHSAPLVTLTIIQSIQRKRHTPTGRKGAHPCPLSLYKERHDAPPCNLNNQSNTKGTRQLEVKAITRMRARTSINRLSLCITVEFCVRRSPSNIAPGTPVASCRSSNTDSWRAR
jgi:hypothetical protein